MLPAFIYEPLPYIYGSAGLTAALNLEHPLGQFSGGLMFCTALVIWAMRRYYRSFNQ